MLERLLQTIGLSRPDVYIANVLKCRPPGNRDPQPEEIEACEGHLFAQVELIRPKVVCTLGNFATKLLSGQPHGITRVHGRPQPRRIGGVDLVLYPIFHPAAALYTPAMMTTLEGDFARLPELLSGPVAAPPAPVPVAVGSPAPSPIAEPEPSPSTPSWVSSSLAAHRADRRGGRRAACARRTSSTWSASWGRGRPRSCAPPAPRSA